MTGMGAGSDRDTQIAAWRHRRLPFPWDVALGQLRRGNVRLAVGIVIWPKGWSHTKLDGRQQTTSNPSSAVFWR